MTSVLTAMANPGAIAARLTRSLSDIRDEWRALRSRYQRDVLAHSQSKARPQRHSLCIFSHFSVDDRVAPYVVSYLRALETAGCDIAFVTSAKPPDADKAAVMKHATEWIQRRNVGYDFGSWSTGFDLCRERLEHYERVVFANDSAYCLTDDLTDTLQRAARTSCDVWSMTSSFEIRPHLQSYFWGVEYNQRTVKFLSYFWHRYYRYLSIRDRVIRRYELQFADIAKSFGLSVGALNPCEATLADARESSNHRQQSLARSTDLSQINPTHHLALELLTSSVSPLVKRELLLRDPRATALCSDIAHWAHEHAPLRWQEVELHLAQCRNQP